MILGVSVTSHNSITFTLYPLGRLIKTGNGKVIILVVESLLKVI